MSDRQGLPAMAVELARKVRARLDPAQRYGLRVALAGLAIVIVAVLFSALTFDVLGRGRLARFDTGVAESMNDMTHHHDWAVTALLAISWLGRPPVLALWVVASIVHVWRCGRHRLAVFLAVTPLGGGIVVVAVKLAVDRPRPVVDVPVAAAFGPSFPSGHAMSSLVTYGALLLVFLPRFGSRARSWLCGATVLLVLAIGCSRLLLGVHFVTDVVGGYLLGAAWLAGATAASAAWRADRGRRLGSPPSEGWSRRPAKGPTV